LSGRGTWVDDGCSPDEAAAFERLKYTDPSDATNGLPGQPNVRRVGTSAENR